MHDADKGGSGQAVVYHRLSRRITLRAICGGTARERHLREIMQPPAKSSFQLKLYRNPANSDQGSYCRAIPYMDTGWAGDGMELPTTQNSDLCPAISDYQALRS